MVVTFHIKISSSKKCNLKTFADVDQKFDHKPNLLEWKVDLKCLKQISMNSVECDRFVQTTVYFASILFPKILVFGLGSRIARTVIDSYSLR